MSVHKTTKDRIMCLLGIATAFVEKYSDNKSPDIVFMVTAFESSFDNIANELVTRKFNADTFRDEIYNFDNVMSSWSENLTYRYESNEENSNTIYDVLFSVLQGINNLIDEDHFAWENDDKESSFDEDGGSIGDETFWKESDNEGIEETSPSDTNSTD